MEIEESVILSTDVGPDQHMVTTDGTMVGDTIVTNTAMHGDTIVTDTVMDQEQAAQILPHILTDEQVESEGPVVYQIIVEEEGGQTLQDNNQIYILTEDGTIEKQPAASSVKTDMAVQANDYEIERRSGKLPARKRIIPLKFRDYQDPEVLNDDPNDADYNPSREIKSPPIIIKPTGRGRGRPRKYPRNPPSHRPLLPDGPTQPLALGGTTQPLPLGGTLEHVSSQTATEDSNPTAATPSDQTGDTVSRLGVEEAKIEIVNECPQIQNDLPLKRGRGRPPNKHKVTTPRGFTCLVCQRVFKMKGNLKTHLMVHADKRPFPCTREGCDKAFRSKEARRRHLLAHDGIKQFPCDVCQKSFSSNVALKEHMNLHLDTKPFKCKTCDKAFRQVSCLSRHERIHAGDKPYKCAVCFKSFAQPMYLRSHMRTHTGEKPFHCDVCNKRFAYRTDMTRHKVIHTGLKPYECEICHARFVDPCSKRRHVKEHTASKRYSCPICGEAFKRGGQLKIHLKSQHYEYKMPDGSESITKYVDKLLESNEKQGVSAHPIIQNISSAQMQQANLITESQNLDPAKGVQYYSTVENSVIQRPVTLDSETSKQILQQYQSKLAGGSEVDINGQPLQMRLQVLHEDDKQQVVEIMYLKPGSEEEIQAEGDLQYVRTIQTDLGVSENVEIVQKTDSEGAVLPISGAGDYGVIKSDRVASLNEVKVEFIKPYEENRTQIDIISTNVEDNDIDIDVENVDSTENMFDSDQICDSDLTTGNTELTLTNKKSDFEIAASNDFVNAPDFSSQAYYNWLAVFTELCKTLPMPSDSDVISKISQVQKHIADVLSKPTGILASKGNFRILKNISKDLNNVVDKHLDYIMDSLKEEEDE